MSCASRHRVGQNAAETELLNMLGNMVSFCPTHDHDLRSGVRYPATHAAATPFMIGS
jgi:hypothetical protein